MLEDNLIYEGARFVLLVPMKMLCHVIFEHSNMIHRMPSISDPNWVEVPEGETFTIDGILDGEVECDFDNHDALCERFVPENIRLQRGTLVFDTCRFFVGRTDVRKFCEYIGQDKFADEDMGLDRDTNL